MRRIPGPSNGAHEYHGGFNSRGRRANSKIQRGLRPISGRKLAQLLAGNGEAIARFVPCEPIVHPALTDPESRAVQRAVRGWSRG
jgi:hypothetical protein